MSNLKLTFNPHFGNVQKESVHAENWVRLTANPIPSTHTLFLD